jgi:DNA polymerase-3 subunit delta
VLAGLRAEGHEPPLLVWVLVQELRLLSRVEESAARLGSVDAALRAEQSWGNRQDAVRAALRRLRRRDIDRCLAEAALLDRTAKGAARGDPWLLFESLVARIAGVPLAA